MCHIRGIRGAGDSEGRRSVSKTGFPEEGTCARSTDVKAVRSHGAGLWERSFRPGAAMVAGAHGAERERGGQDRGPGSGLYMEQEGETLVPSRRAVPRSDAFPQDHLAVSRSQGWKPKHHSGGKRGNPGGRLG